MFLKSAVLSDKQRWPWSDAAERGIWSGPTLFAHAYQSQYLGLIRILRVPWKITVGCKLNNAYLYKQLQGKKSNYTRTHKSNLK